MILETERLYLREMTQSDYSALCKLLQDPDVMATFTKGVYTDSEVQEALNKTIQSYKEHGCDQWAVVLKENDEMIGKCGPHTMDFEGEQIFEIGYIFQKAYWHKGYATEAAIACREYSFCTLGLDEIYSYIMETNMPSRHVAERNGMTVYKEHDKHYPNGDVRRHLLYSVRRPKLEEST